MSSELRDDPVSEAVDAVVWNEDVDWERYARQAAPAQRRMLDNLRALAPAFATGDAAVAGSPASARAAEPAAGSLVRRAVAVLFAIAALELAAAAVLLPWHWDDYRRVHGDVAVYVAILLAGHGASAALLLIAGRRERRTWLLGGYFLFRATLAPLHVLPAFLGHLPPADLLPASLWEMPAPTMTLLHVCGLPLALAVPPAFLWAFARECPRVHRGTRLDDLARRMVPISAAVVGALCAGVASVYVARLVDDAVSVALYVAVLEAAIAASGVLSLAAVVVVALRARTAPAAEVRRVVLFSLGLLVWMALATAYDLVEAVSPGLWPSNYDSSSVLRSMQPMRFPGMVLLWYSVMAARVPHPREAFRAFYRRLLMRRGRLWLTAAVLWAALGWLVAGQREQTLGAVVADPWRRRSPRRRRSRCCCSPAARRSSPASTRGSLPRRPTSGACSPRPSGRWGRRGSSRRWAGPWRERSGAAAARRPPCCLRPATRRAAPASGRRTAGFHPCPPRRRSSTFWRRPTGRCGCIRATRRRPSRCCPPRRRRGWWRRRST